MYYGGYLLCTTATSLALRLNLPSIFILKTMFVLNYLNPGFTFPSLICSGVTEFKILKATGTLAISFSIDFVPKVVPVC